MLSAAVVLIILRMTAPAGAGPIAYGLCQAGCATAVVTCYSTAGFVFGTVLAVAAPPAIVACNLAQGSCYAACAALAFAPTP